MLKSAIIDRDAGHGVDIAFDEAAALRRDRSDQGVLMERFRAGRRLLSDKGPQDPRNRLAVSGSILNSPRSASKRLRVIQEAAATEPVGYRLADQLPATLRSSRELIFAPIACRGRPSDRDRVEPARTESRPLLSTAGCNVNVSRILLRMLVRDHGRKTLVPVHCRKYFRDISHGVQAASVESS